MLNHSLGDVCARHGLWTGLDAGKIKQVGVICGQESTRRIGDYKVKYGYSDIELLRCMWARASGDGSRN